MNSQQSNSLSLNSMKQLISDFIKRLHQTSIILYSLFQYTCNRHSFNFIDKVGKIFSLNIVQLIYDTTGEGLDVFGFLIHGFPSKKTKKGVRNMYKAPKIRTCKAVEGYLYSLCKKSLKLFSIM